MRINAYQWQLYLRAGGQETVERFAHVFDNGRDLRDLILPLFTAYCPDAFLAEALEESVAAFAQARANDAETHPETDAARADIYESEAAHLWKEIAEEYADARQKRVTDRQIFEYFADDIVYISLMLAAEFPDAFVPYFFPCCYHVLTAIADMFDIQLPQMPGQRDYAGRFHHYFALCRVLQAERKEMAWSAAELCAFLYDYAPKAAGGLGWLWQELPPPRAAYVIGASPEDRAFQTANANANGKDVVCWQGNPDTQPGDVVLLYHWAPASRFSSVWRACAPGFVDPFFAFYRCVYIGRPVAVPGPSFREIKEDERFCDSFLVKTRMLRMDGLEIMPSEYARIRALIEQAGGDISRLPVLDVRFASGECPKQVERERDVELYLLEPLLKRLGWERGQYVRQMPLRMGRMFTVYPDYVILPKATPGHERGYWVVEAKKSIPTAKQLKIDCAQASSYALRLNAKGLMLVSQEGVWTATREEDFEDTTYYRWEDLHEDAFAKLYAMAGNRKRKKAARGQVFCD